MRAGRDVTILCYSRMRYVVMQAVAELEKATATTPRCAAVSRQPTHVLSRICSTLWRCSSHTADPARPAVALHDNLVLQHLLEARLLRHDEAMQFTCLSVAYAQM